MVPVGSASFPRSNGTKLVGHRPATTRGARQEPTTPDAPPPPFPKTGWAPDTNRRPVLALRGMPGPGPILEAMSPVAWIVLLWVAFALTHMGLSSLRARGRLSAALGEQGFLGLYSLVSLVVFVPLVWIYFANKHLDPLLWAVPQSEVLRWVLYVGNGVAIVLATAALITPSPAIVGAPAVETRGVHFLTRHGRFMGVALWALLHGLISLQTNRPDYAWSKGLFDRSLDAMLHGLLRADATAGLPR